MRLTSASLGGLRGRRSMAHNTANASTPKPTFSHCQDRNPIEIPPVVILAHANSK
jgi:hypothetical protein